jgi:hypothetical protein
MIKNLHLYWLCSISSDGLAHVFIDQKIAYLQIKEGSRPVIVKQFARYFNIIEAISDGNLDEDSLFHSGFSRRNADRNEENRS